MNELVFRLLFCGNFSQHKLIKALLFCLFITLISCNFTDYEAFTLQKTDSTVVNYCIDNNNHFLCTIKMHILSIEETVAHGEI